jgi:SAM-dependent methyltransferase
MSIDSSRQKRHYETIHCDYEDHYYDAQSMDFRERFYYDPLFEGLNLNGCAVADLACGSGHNSLSLLKRFPTAMVTGFDISTTACEEYRRNVGRPCIESDLTRPLLELGAFDAAMVVGGLHHCVADLPTVLHNLANMLKPEGCLLMLEPNRAFALELARRLWYRLDKYFDATTERAIAYSELVEQAGAQFTPERVAYYGGPGYFLISQSLLFRIPKPVKRAISPPLMVVERVFNRLPIAWFHPYFVARWIRTGSPLSTGTRYSDKQRDADPARSGGDAHQPEWAAIYEFGQPRD